jgi:hypothetical protein
MGWHFLFVYDTIPSYGVLIFEESKQASERAGGFKQALIEALDYYRFWKEIFFCLGWKGRGRGNEEFGYVSLSRCGVDTMWM